MLAAGFYSNSDQRIKKNICDIDLANYDLIKPISYDLIDRNSNRKIGLLAQDVQKIYPDAININKDFIPNIHCLGKYTNGFVYIKNIDIDIIVGDIVKFITLDNEFISEIISVIYTVESIGLQINQWNNLTENESVFCYGKEVNDLLSVEYNYINTLTLTAALDLRRRVSKLEKLFLI